MLSCLEIGRLHPWHQGVNESSSILAFNGVVLVPQIVYDVLTVGDLLLGVHGGQVRKELVQSSHGCVLVDH